MGKETIINKSLTPTKQFTTAIHEIKDKEQEKIQNWINHNFCNNFGYKKSMLIGYSQFQGRDPIIASMFRMSKHSDDLPKLMTMLVMKATQIFKSRYYQAVISEDGSYVRTIAERFNSTDHANAVMHTINFYLRKKMNIKSTVEMILENACLAGAGISRQNWMYRERAFDKPIRGNYTKINPLTGTLLKPQNLFERITIPTDDRPDFTSVDPLFFELENSATDLGPDGGQICCEKKIMSRKQLNSLIKQGRLDEKFLILKEDQIGGNHKNGYEAREMREFYNNLFNGKLNDGIDFEDDEYKFIVDWVWRDGNEEDPVTSFLSINGNLLSKTSWMGGPFIPYQIYKFMQGRKSWVGMTLPEAMQDKLRMYTYVLNLTLRDAIRSGIISTGMPSDAMTSKEELQRFIEGKPFKYDLVNDGVSPKDKFVQLKHGEISQGLIQTREWLSQEMMQDLGIGLQEVAGADMGSGIRSGKMIQSMNSQGGRVANMQTSLMLEAFTNMFNQLKYLIYTLQSEPIDVLITGTDQLTTIGNQSLDALPDVLVYPAVNMAQLTGEMLWQSNFLLK